MAGGVMDTSPANSKLVDLNKDSPESEESLLAGANEVKHADAVSAENLWTKRDGRGGSASDNYSKLDDNEGILCWTEIKVTPTDREVKTFLRESFWKWNVGLRE